MHLTVCRKSLAHLDNLRLYSTNDRRVLLVLCSLLPRTASQFGAFLCTRRPAFAQRTIRATMTSFAQQIFGEWGIMICGVLFDQDGTMFDTERIWYRSWKPTLDEFGLPFPEGLADDMRGTGYDAGLKIMRSYLGQDIDAYAIRRRLGEIAEKSIRTELQMKPGLVELLDYLRAQDIKCAVATSTEMELTAHNLAHAGISDYFDAVVTGDMITHSKPNPEIFLLAAQKIGTQPAETLVLEDSRQGVRAGHDGGFVTVMIPDMTPPDEHTPELTSAICKDFFEVRDLLKSGELG